MTLRAAHDPRFRRGLEEFRAGRPFEAHEEWERLWNDSSGEDRLFVQALIQIAAGCVHLTRGNGAPARRLFALALAKLEGVPDGLAPFPLDPLREALRAPLPEEAGDPRRLFPL